MKVRVCVREGPVCGRDARVFALEGRAGVGTVLPRAAPPDSGTPACSNAANAVSSSSGSRAAKSHETPRGLRNGAPPTRTTSPRPGASTCSTMAMVGSASPGYALPSAAHNMPDATHRSGSPPRCAADAPAEQATPPQVVVQSSPSGEEKADSTRRNFMAFKPLVQSVPGRARPPGQCAACGDSAVKARLDYFERRPGLPFT